MKHAGETNVRPSQANSGRRNTGLLLAILGFGLANSANAITRNVGPGQSYATPCAAIAAASDGDTIQIDAAGSYNGDVCAWTKNALTLKGINGRPHIDAANQNAQGKAIWVISGNDTVVDNIEFSGCHVPDANGAGIRQEGVNLTVRHAYFHDNENGILAGDKSGSTITIESSEFAHNGAGDGRSHNLYINHVDKLIFQYNYSHGAYIGHLLKSRALQNDILYNRLSGDPGGSESYEINLPNGGLSYVIGNLIEQPTTSPNSAMLDYRSETDGMNADDRLFVVNNTFVNDKGVGTFLQIGAGTASAVVATNNIFYGGSTISSQPSTLLSHNYSGGNPMFVDIGNFNYRLEAGSAAIDAGIDPGSGAGRSLLPTQEYVQPATSQLRPSNAAIDIGAYEFMPDLIFCDGFEAIKTCH